MKKYLTYFQAPVLNRSGYGKLADNLAIALMNYPKFDFHILRDGWGGNVGRITETAADKQILAKCITAQQIPQPDIYISNTLPHSSKQNLEKGGMKAKLININYSAGLEVDKCYDYFIDGLNAHTVNIVCSEFAKASYVGPNRQLTAPIEVVPWGADTTIYKISNDITPAVQQELEHIKEQEAFLFVGQAHYDLTKERKDMGGLIKTFCETFKDKDRQPALILKTNLTTFCNYGREAVLDVIRSVTAKIQGKLPNVYLLYGELTEMDMNALYNHPKIIAHVSFTHGEGFGAPLLEASLSGKPVFAPNHSGHLTFLDDNAQLLDGKIDYITDANVSEFLIKCSRWFYVDYDKAGKRLADYFYGDRKEANAKAKELAARNTDMFNLDKFQYRLHKVLDKYVK